MIYTQSGIQVEIVDVCIDDNGISAHVCATEKLDPITGDAWERVAYPIESLTADNESGEITEAIEAIDLYFFEKIRRYCSLKETRLTSKPKITNIYADRGEKQNETNRLS